MSQDPNDRREDPSADPRSPGEESAPADHEPAKLSPLPGEPGITDLASRQRVSMSRKGLLAVGLLIGGIVALAGYTIHRFAASGEPTEDPASKLVKDRPAAASTEPRRLDMAVAPAASAPSARQTAGITPRIPALVPTGAEAAEPIGVRRTGSGAHGSTGSGNTKVVPPEDAPIMVTTTRPGALAKAHSDAATPAGTEAGPAEAANPADPIAATSRNLQGYQRQLQGLMDNLTKVATQATGRAPVPGLAGAPLGGPPGAGTPPGGAPSSGGGLFGGQLQGSATPKVAATHLGDRSLVMPKGTAFTCALKTKVISATSGLVGCQVQRNLFSDDGRVLLVERGSHLDGEYRVASVRPGTVRIPVLWTRIRTPLGVTVALESPGTGPLGESGIPGHVDNRWMERIGAAMLLSLIDDAVQITIANQQSGADTVVLPSTTDNTSKLAEKVLESTINIPPLIYQNQGGIVGIYVARDVDFSSVYELQPTAMDAPRGVGQ